MKIKTTLFLLIFLCSSVTYAAENKEPSVSIDKLSKLAEQGDAKSQNSLATIYFKGDGAPQDHKEAFKWFSKAAEQGMADAQLQIGYMYISGMGVKQDYKKAHQWYLQAAENGDAKAQYSIALNEL